MTVALSVAQEVDVHVRICGVWVRVHNMSLPRSVHLPAPLLIAEWVLAVDYSSSVSFRLYFR